MRDECYCVFSSESADAVRKDATLSSSQRHFVLNLSSCLVSMTSHSLALVIDYYGCHLHNSQMLPFSVLALLVG